MVESVQLKKNMCVHKLVKKNETFRFFMPIVRLISWAEFLVHPPIPMTSSSQSASKLRRRLHDECANGDLQSLRDTLHSLYEDDDSPLGTHGDIANPAAFAALVEITCLAQAHAAAEPDNRVRAHIAEEMEQNVERLRSGFCVNKQTMKCVRLALNACEESETLDEAHYETVQALKGTQLDRRVKVARHSVSWVPSKRGGRTQSPPPRRFDDLDEAEDRDR